MNEKYFMDFLETAERKGKPRDVGITFVGDWGVTLTEAKEKLELVSDYIDLIKIVRVSGRLCKNEYIQKKVKLYEENDIITFPGGVLCEYAIVQNKFHEFLKSLQDMGFGAVEISLSKISLPHATMCRLVEIAAKDYGLKVIPELYSLYGPSGPSGKVNVAHTIDMMKDLLKIGAWKVNIEGNVLLAEGVGTKPSVIRDFNTIVEQVGSDNLIFEIQSNQMLTFWLIDTYGSNINLGNVTATIEPRYILMVEAARRKMIQTIVNARIPSDILKL